MWYHKSGVFPDIFRERRLRQSVAIWPTQWHTLTKFALLSYITGICTEYPTALNALYALNSLLFWFTIFRNNGESQVLLASDIHTKICTNNAVWAIDCRSSYVYVIGTRPLTTCTLPWTDRTQYTHRSNYCFKPFTTFRSIPSSIVLHFLLQDAVSAKILKSLKVPTLKVSEVYISGESIMWRRERRGWTFSLRELEYTLNCAQLCVIIYVHVNMTDIR